jgi:hypothetical protein
MRLLILTANTAHYYTTVHCRTKTVLSGDLTSHSSSGSYRGHSGSGRSIGAEDSWPVVKILLEPKVLY